MNNDMQSRRDRIFEIVVSSYIDTAEPVGSRTISRHSDLGLSPASIRNVMADLEEEGYLRQPHTSAGRVPTDKGYRYYVDRLMSAEDLTPEEKEWIRAELERARTVDAMVEKMSRVISELTGNAALIFVKRLKRVSFLSQILEELIEAERLSDFLEEEPSLFIDGASRIFGQPEFQDLRKMQLLLQEFDAKRRFLEILSRDLESDGVQVHIGSESPVGEIEDVSLVVKDYYLGEVPIGGVAVVGPTRMRYSRVVSVVNFVADTVSEKVSRY